MKRGILILFFGLLLTGLLRAEELSDIFQAANRYYQENQYKKAIEHYEMILEKGYEAPELYYNIGNAYYKKGKLAPAMLNYERAKQLQPADEDILFNLRLAKMQVADKIEPLPRLFFVRWWHNFLHINPSSGWAVFTLVFIWLGFLSAVTFLLTQGMKPLKFFITLFFLSLGILSSVFAYQQYRHERHTREAIVFAENTYVKSAPDKESTDLFVLHEGVKVQVLDRVGSWKKVRLADGKVGWLGEETLREI